MTTKPLLPYIDEVIKVIQKGWCQGTWARNDKGEPCLVGGQATKHCLMGAIYTTRWRLELSPELRDSFVNQLTEFIIDKTNFSTIASFNDYREHRADHAVQILRDFKEFLEKTC